MDEFIIWAAGLFDGEGCISIKKPQYHLEVTVTNTYKPALESFKQRFDGSIRITGKSSRTDKHASKIPAYQFAFSYQGAKEFLILALPYLRIKRLEAEIALDYISTISNLASLRGGRLAGRKMTGLERKARLEFRRQLQAIRKGEVVTPSKPLVVPQGRLFSEN